MLALIRDAQALPTPTLPELEPLEHVHAGRGVAANHRLLDIFQKTLEGYFRMWHHHFEFLLLGLRRLHDVLRLLQEGLPGDHRPDDRAHGGGHRRGDLPPGRGTAAPGAPRRGTRRGRGISRGRAGRRTSSGRSSSPGAPGRAWLDELATARDPWFNINVGDGFYHYHRSWNDDLSMPFSGLPDYVRRVRAGESLDRPVEKLKAERRQLIEDYRELLATDDDRAAYDQMITLAHRVFPYVEGHKFYCEHWYTNLFFNKIREFGALLAAHGFFPGAEDVFHLTHYELEAAIIDLMNSWSTGSPPRGPDRWPAIVTERRAAIAEWAKHDTPPALGPVPDVIDDPAIVMLWGITRESLETWLHADSDASSNELRGFAASSGVAEGPARVVKSVEEIARLQKGDILVCQVTNPTWAPVFQKISGAVSDIGGSMSHAAIVAREYGLPAVVGTGTATSRIKDGQRIRVDGGRGVVTILG